MILPGMVLRGRRVNFTVIEKWINSFGFCLWRGKKLDFHFPEPRLLKLPVQGRLRPVRRDNTGKSPRKMQKSTVTNVIIDLFWIFSFLAPGAASTRGGNMVIKNRRNFFLAFSFQISCVFIFDRIPAPAHFTSRCLRTHCRIQVENR